MRIDAITCCTSALYADHLKKGLPIWLDTLDSVTIVTKPTDDHVLKFTGPSNLNIITTDVFTQYGAYLNKGAVLNLAYAASDPREWVLHFDADIVPPADWRQKIESQLFPSNLNYLYGAKRRLDNGQLNKLHKSGVPIGYFQIWYSADPATWKWPLFPCHYPHCGGYDMDFAESWNNANYVHLDLEVRHYGKSRTHWFGVVGGQGPMNKMRQGRYARSQMKTVDLPEPKLKFILDKRNPEWVLEVLRVCRKAGPFDVWATINLDQDESWDYLDNDIPVDEIQSEIEDMMKGVYCGG